MEKMFSRLVPTTEVKKTWKKREKQSKHDKFWPRVSMKIVLLITPLVIRSFSKTFSIEIQEGDFSIKCNWVV